MSSAIAITDDRMLGGKLLLRQPASGHRAGHDALLLAAATSARSAQSIADFGAGVGTAGLAVARRVPGVLLTMVEIDPILADLARHNVRINDLSATVATLDVTAAPDAFLAAGLPPDSLDGVLMNPPFNDPSRHRGSPDELRQSAHVATRETLDGWLRAARRVLKPRGVLTMIWRADGIAEVTAALGRGFGSLALMPVYGDPAAPAIRLLVRAVKGSRGPAAIYPGVALRDANGEPDHHIQQVLAGQAALSWASL